MLTLLFRELELCVDAVEEPLEVIVIDLHLAWLRL
jgi:hypothetical protein